jgi:DNA helicase-2/ATP-dependent DNA helicase PcrA
MPLTLAQQAVVEATTGHLIVLAGPGSGKTHTITEKILFLFHEAVISEPYGLLAITFTNAAANEMRSRLRSKGFRQWDQIWVGTFHGFGHYLLTCYGGDVGIQENFNVIEGDEQYEILQRIASERLRGVSVRDLLDQITNFKRQGIYPGRGDERLARSLRIAYTEYQRVLTERNLVDFADLMAFSVRLLKESELAKRLFTNFFSYVVVDEFQDTNQQQLEMVRIMATDAQGSTVVADDDQAIYRFRGADRTNIVTLERLLDAERFTLDTNFRSDQVIVDAANSVINYEANRTPKGIVAASDRRGHLYKQEFPNVMAEAQQVVTWISELYEANKVEDWGEIAVITRQRRRAEPVLDAMDEAQIPWFDRARLSFRDSWETTLGLSILGLSSDLDSSDGLYRVMVAVENGGLAYYLDVEDALEIAIRIRERLASSQDWEPKPANVQTILDTAQIDEMLRKYARSDNEYTRLSDNLHTMVADVVQEAQSLELTLKETIDRLDGYGALQVISSHGSKGQEFDYVFMVGLEDDVLPDYRARRDEEVDEERRIFYVSLTRARKAAYLTNASERLMPWGEVQEKSPSRFISHIPEQFFSSTE